MAPAGTTKERLLDAVLEHVAAEGAHDLSLRGVAAAVGTSHRMLSYHFGSREGLLVAMTRAVEQRERDALVALSSRTDASPLEVMADMYERLVDPALWPQERLFFELYVRGLRGDPEAEPLLDGIVEPWLDPVAGLFRRLGFDDRAALAEARLAVAVCRGLLLDLLATNDRAATEEAMHAFLDRYRDRAA